MRKIYITTIFIIFNFIAFSQNDFELPELSVPSPQANGLAQFGNLNIDESTGKFIHTIDLPSFRAGGIIVPISLTYIGNGVKVDENPTWTGMSWNLNAGGVITRTVRDLPDETTKPSYHYSPEDIHTILTNGEMDAVSYGNFVATNHLYDSESDLFNFNFLGYSGSFYLLKNSNGIFEGKLLKYDQELKIDIIGNFSAPNGFYDYLSQTTNNPLYEFKITTPDGNQYFFGGMALPLSGQPSYAFEETQLISPNPLHQTLRVRTAFYLNKIVGLNGDVVNFSYETISNFNLFYKEKEMLFSTIHCSPDPENICGMSGQGPNSPSPVVNGTISNKVYNGKFLKTIWSPQSDISVSFSSNSIFENQNFKHKILNEINYGSYKVAFKYFTTINSSISSHTDKFFLQEVCFKKDTKITQKYSFEYQNLHEVPRIVSNSQDYLGFYNGKLTNLTLLPKNSDKFLLRYAQGYGTNYDNSEGSFLANFLNFAKFENYSFYLADREPVFSKACNGCLTKINYPTGGSTEIEYEPVEKKPISENQSLSIVFDPINGSQMTRTFTFPMSTIDGNGNVVNNLPYLPDEQIATLRLSITGNHALGVQNLNYRDFVLVTITNVTTGEVFRKGVSLGSEIMTAGGNSYSNSIDFIYTFYKNNTYTIKLGFGNAINGSNTYIENPNTNLLTPKLQGALQFDLLTGFHTNEGLGIRVKKIKDTSPNINLSPNIKRYYYGDLKRLDDSGKTFYYPLFQNFSFQNFYCTYQAWHDDPINHIDIMCTTMVLNSISSNVFLPKLPQLSPNKTRSVIVSLGGDNFEKGGYYREYKDIQDEFQSMGDLGDLNILPFPSDSYVSTGFNLKVLNNLKTNTSTLDGLLLKELYFKRNNQDQLVIIKENKYNYFLTEYYSNANMQYEKMYDIIGRGKLTPTEGYYQGFYFNYSYKPELKEKTETDFLSDFTISQYLQENPFVPNLMKISTTTLLLDDENNLFANLPHHTKTITSNGDILETKNYYPTDYFINSAPLSSSSSEDIAAYNALKEENRIEQPVLIENYVNGVKISSLRNRYKKYYNDKPYQLYKIFGSKKDQPEEERIEYVKYDENNNPTEIKKSNGTLIVYVWGKHRLPLYKIVNFPFENTIPTATSLGIDSTSGGFISDHENLIALYLDSQITCYNYNTLNSLTRITQPNGDYITYHYDEFNRLKFVKDKNNNILTENQIHYLTDQN